jgi:hypothetical protein
MTSIAESPKLGMMKRIEPGFIFLPRLIVSCSMILGLLLGTSGCGSKWPKTVPVSGKVTLDENPVEGAAVCLIPDSGGRFGYGTTDANGDFTVSTFEANDGATLGSHKIVITKADVIAPNRVAATIEEQDELTRAGVEGWIFKSLIPEKYGNPDTTELSVEVVKGMRPLTLQLSSKANER